MSDVQEWMDCLDRYIVEEDKIVTYKWLSIKLKIHVNTSKKLLYSYANTHDKENLGICYLIAGEMEDGSCHVMICRKKDLSKTKALFKNVTSQHVYSVQKRDTDADLNVILNSPVKRIEECIEDFKRLTSIEYSESVVRDNTDLQKLKMKALLASKEAVPSISKPAASDDKKQIKTEKENHPSNNTSKETKKENVSGKKGGLAAMFAAQKEVKTEVKKPAPQQSKPKGGLSMFLNSEKKNDVAKSSKIKQDLSPKKDKPSEESSQTMEVDLTSDEEKESKKADSKKDTKNKTKTTQSKRKRKEKSEDKQKKKRKRIMTVSDSESNDEDNEEEERLDDSPLREPTPPPPPISDDEVEAEPIAGKKAKKKKLVESTFMDDEGFLVTKKEYKMVSDSDDEVETEKVNKSEKDSQKLGDETAKVDEKRAPAKDPPKPSASKKESKPLPSKSKISPKSKMSPQKNKQASITSFFTKK
ncbi:DNA polymerase delta subunit 3 isoform X2 [Nilaparvata lugens]|uniref:DNA polymerase delta subunit 3 isoform X2 n=1 Tax=Nilaparvata lugens TaxID=108931 RepID=UPI00193DCF85|nr:DNA polymerase delta subunit 3 isoform X2 [Nilaparvata lugens]